MSAEDKHFAEAFRRYRRRRDCHDWASQYVQLCDEFGAQFIVREGRRGTGLAIRGDAPGLLEMRRADESQ